MIYDYSRKSRRITFGLGKDSNISDKQKRDKRNVDIFASQYQITRAKFAVHCLDNIQA